MPDISKIKKIFYILFPIALISTVILVVMLVRHPANQQLYPKRTPFAKQLESYTPESPEKNIHNILLIGYGGAGHSGGVLADAQILASINMDSKKVTLTAIPRDLWVNLPVRSDQYQHRKINMAYAIGLSDTLVPFKRTEYGGHHGGGELAKDAVEIVTGLEVDNYAAVDFNRFERAINALDGIEVDVPVAFTDKYFPVPGLENETCGFSAEKIEDLHEQFSGFELEKQFECRYETLSFNKGPSQMDGETALKFIRSRHSDAHGGDFARGVREQAVLTAIKDKLLSLDALENIDQFYEEFRRMIITDITEGDILELLSKSGEYQNYQFNKLNITTDNFLTNSTSSDGQYILLPKAGQDNWSEVQTFVKQNI